ncbi:hypothetical protein [Streptomyces sp. Act143]|nr:hypothetical protein [Streptomyces sp. Act143]
MRRTLATIVAVTAAALIAVLGAGASDSGAPAQQTVTVAGAAGEPNWS